MNSSTDLQSFRPSAPDAAGVLSWVHIGDLHMREAGQQNHLDLQAIAEKINAVFKDSISFVFLPGDNADHGDAATYAVIRQVLDGLTVPWCAIVGDHDVEEKSFDNFQASLAERTHYAFTGGNVRFLALNAFDRPDPKSFSVGSEQLRWVEEQLQAATEQKQETVLLLHCYPSDLKEGAEELSVLIRKYGVKLVDMGHTHYNEVSHDGKTVYTATRSTGQIEEGAVGFSVTNLDHGAVSWRFFELSELPAVMITSPPDERLLPDDTVTVDLSRDGLRVRVKVWGKSEIVTVEGRFLGTTITLQRIEGTNTYQGEFPRPGTSSARVALPSRPLRVVVTDVEGNTAFDEIRLFVGANRPSRKRATRDQDNALEAWPAHGLLSTQLGPNKNGRKW